MWNQIDSGEPLYWGWLIAWAAILLLAGIAAIYRRYKRIRQVKYFIEQSTQAEKENYINQIVAPAGFLYNSEKDIFYAREDGWQKRYGYARIYDEAAPLLGMIIDCEPIYFNYDDRRWLLELWKGQYGMTVGGEIGLYQSTNENGSIPGQFYFGVDSSEYIGMQMELFDGNKHVFGQKKQHWWLTGFRLGDWAYPWQIKMVVTLTFLNRQMCQRFLEGLRRAGYHSNEYQVRGETVRILFDQPHTRQPQTRRAITDRIRVRRMRFFCRMYHRITREYQNTCDKIIVLQIKAPRLFARAMQIGKTLKLFERNKLHE